MEAFRSNIKIARASIGSVNKCVTNLSKETSDNGNWRNFVKSENYDDDISSKSSACPIDENSNVLNDIAEAFDDLKIEPAIITAKVASKDRRGESPEGNLAKFEDLIINSNSVENCMNPTPAGKVESIAVSMGIALVKPSVADSLLDIDTPLFLCVASLSYENAVPSDCALVGHIDDIFGPVGDPMYSVRLESDIYELLTAQTEIYYLDNHPNTTLIHVEERTDKSFHLIRTKSKLFHE